MSETVTGKQLLTLNEQWVNDCRTAGGGESKVEFNSANDILSHGFLSFCRTKDEPHKIAGIFQIVRGKRADAFSVKRIVVFNPPVETKNLSTHDQAVYALLAGDADGPRLLAIGTIK